MSYHLPDWPKVRAFENNVFLVWVDQVETSNSSSKSYIISPETVLKKIEGREGIIYHDINLKDLKK